jgi:hypothetical protein
MERIALYFGNNELYRVEFTHRLLPATIASARGKAQISASASASFQWTRAVQALAILLIKGALHQHTVGASRSAVAIEGESNSLAASLDYALGRRPTWLTEMFGLHLTKRPITRLLFERSNPEQRLPGPVAVVLRLRARSELKIDIFEYSKPVRDPVALNALLVRLEPTSKHQTMLNDNAPPLVSEQSDVYESLRSVLRPAYRAEVLRSLTVNTPWDRESLQTCVSDFMKNPSLTRRLGRKVDEFGRLLRRTDTTTRLGLEAHQEDVIARIRAAGEMQVVAPVVFAASLAIFTYLKHWRGLPFKILDHFPHAVESSSQLARGKFSSLPDFVLQGLGPAITAMKSPVGAEYSPFVMMPEGKITLLTPGVSTKGLGHVYLLNDQPSSPLFLLENLMRDFGYKGGASHEELDTSIRRLRNGEKGEASILMFPFNYLARRYTTAVEHDAPRGSVRADYILFASKRVTSEPNLASAFESVIHDAWLELISNTTLRNAVVEKLLSDEQHLRVITRGSGLLNELKAAPLAA